MALMENFLKTSLSFVLIGREMSYRDILTRSKSKSVSCTSSLNSLSNLTPIQKKNPKKKPQKIAREGFILPKKTRCNLPVLPYSLNLQKSAEIIF